jgi:hypothetical protein
MVVVEVAEMASVDLFRCGAALMIDPLKLAAGIEDQRLTIGRPVRRLYDLIRFENDGLRGGLNLDDDKLRDLASNERATLASKSDPGIHEVLLTKRTTPVLPRR